MAIVRAFEYWRVELQSVENPNQVLTDHKNLENCMLTSLPETVTLAADPEQPDMLHSACSDTSHPSSPQAGYQHGLCCRTALVEWTQCNLGAEGPANQTAPPGSLPRRWDTKDLAGHFLQWVFHLNGLPETITLDRGTQFASHFWGGLGERLQTERCMSTAIQSETDGKTERFNAVMEQYLRFNVNNIKDNWSLWLPLAEFATTRRLKPPTLHPSLPYRAITKGRPRICRPPTIQPRATLTPSQRPQPRKKSMSTFGPR